MRRAPSFGSYDNKLLDNVMLSQVNSQPFVLFSLATIKESPPAVKLLTRHQNNINRLKVELDKAFRKEYSQNRGMKSYKIIPKSFQPKQKQLDITNCVDDDTRQRLRNWLQVQFEHLYHDQVSEIKYYKKQLHYMVESKIKDERARLKHISSREIEDLSRQNEERRVERKKKLPPSPNRVINQSNKDQVYREHQEECSRLNRLLHEKQRARESDMDAGHQKYLKNLNADTEQLLLDAFQEYNKNCTDVDKILEEKMLALNVP